MSKINLRLSYKNACILKHTLRDKVQSTECFLTNFKRLINSSKEENQEFLNVLQEEYNEKFKEYEEEKRALAAITEEINNSCIKHNGTWNK